MAKSRRRDKIFATRMHRNRFLLLSASVFLAVIAASLQIRAQTTSASYVVAEVHASGSQRYSDAQIAATTRLKPDDPVNTGTLQEIADYLTQLGIFSRVNFRFTAKNGRANVNFQVQDAPVVPVIFENFPWFTDQELSDEIRHAVPLFDGAAPRGGSLLEQITAVLSHKLASRGIKANVEHTLVSRPSSDGEIMQFRQDGEDFTVASVSFGDSIAQNSEKLHDRVSDLIGKKFSRFAIELFENEQVRPIYLSAGHIRVKFDPPVVHLNAAAAGQNPATVDLQIPLQPGPVYHIAGVAWAGNVAMDEPTLSRLVAPKTEDLADGMQLAAGWQQIELAYGHRGYLDAKVTPIPQFDDANRTVRYNVMIVEGPQYRMGQLVITGLSIEAERALRNSWKLAPGDVFDKTFVDSTFAKLEKPTVAIFGELPVHYEKMGNWLRPNPQTHVMDVLIDFQ
jgi:hypothetical protein